MASIHQREKNQAVRLLKNTKNDAYSSSCLITLTRSDSIMCIGLVLIFSLAGAVQVVSAADQTPYCPTKEELTALFPWGGPVYKPDKDGDPYRYSCEADDYISPHENGRAYQGFSAESYADRTDRKGYVSERDVKVEGIGESVEIIEYFDLSYSDISVEDWRKHEAENEAAEVVFHDVADIGDKAYAVSLYRDERNYNSDPAFETKFMRLCFTKDHYYVQVTLEGADEKLVRTYGSEGRMDREAQSDSFTAEPFPTENSVPTLEKITAVARIIEKKLPGAEKKTCPMGGVRPSESCPQ